MQSTEIRRQQPPVDVGQEYIRYCRHRLCAEYLPRIEKCLDVLSQEDVWWRAHETNNSIGSLILHLSGNVRQWIVSGLGGGEDIRRRQAEFEGRSMVPKHDLLRDLRNTLQDADDVLQHFPSQHLLEVRHIQKYDVTCLDALSHVVEHFAQHLGQIVYIVKLRTGKDLKFYDL